MSAARFRRPSPWPLLLLGLAVCNTTSEPELLCAEATARLEDCCPGFDGATYGFSCETSGSAPGRDAPVIPREASACILAASCEALQATLVCARAKVWVVGGTWPIGAPQGLCP